MNVTRGFRWVCGVAAAVLLAHSALSAPVVTESGVISGLPERELVVYRGVPFAAPPIGPLRWRPPAPVTHWEGTRKADTFAPACMQEGVSMPGETPPAVSEDCLYLNIWTPDLSNPPSRAGSHLSVMVWIYGGGFTNGSASMPL